MRRVPWDSLPSPYRSSSLPSQDLQQPKQEEDLSETRDYKKDAIEIARRTGFGVVCGSLTGAAFGAVDVLRDHKAMTGKANIATSKMIRFTGLFAGFFGSYHGIRKTLQFYNPQPAEVNVTAAGTVCIIPLIAIGSLRPMIPYAIMLVALDAINGIND
eukprot:gene12962-17378_t